MSFKDFVKKKTGEYKQKLKEENDFKKQLAQTRKEE